jgi:hypothetical protein
MDLLFWESHQTEFWGNIVKQKEGGELNNETPRVEKERKALWRIWVAGGGGRVGETFM